MGDGTDALEVARDAYRRRDWVAARSAFDAARDAAPLGADDLYALANCGWWLGDLDEALPLQEEAYRCYLAADRPAAAAFAAIDLGYTLAIRGDEAQASGWLQRAVRLLEDQPECVEHGYLAYVEFEEAFDASDLDTALDAAARVRALGRRLDDLCLTALGVLGEGRVRVRRGDVRTGMALLDEAMLAAVSDELDPAWAGNIYCHLMVACVEIADLRRAGEWTEATVRWCETMPGAGPFMGICRVHRAQILQTRGAFDAAEREARRVCDELAHFDLAVVAEAQYLLGELRRQRGDLAGAEVAFVEAHRLGRDPQPGLALLHLDRGELDGAAASIRSALAAVRDDDPATRARLLPAAVEVGLATGDVEQAHRWSDQLAEAAATYGTTGFAASSRYARGTVLLAAGDAAGAVPVLRGALRAAHELEAPYMVARVRRALATAYATLGDRAAAELEQRAADAEMSRLGVDASAAPAPASVAPDAQRPGDPVGLTRREREVLAQVATGRSNQEIADELVLSVRTIERHLATVYQKLGVSGRSARAAAVSHALRAGMLPRL
jgi:ATP/maltotriose-dependent transcriptional regulator MalT